VEFAIGIGRSGYNLYVMGSAGVGKHRLLKDLLAGHAGDQPPPSDWCYVADFANPDRPNALELPQGRGQGLRRDMRQLVADLLTSLPAAFHSDEYQRRAQEIRDEFKGREDEAAAEIGRHAAERGVALLHTPTGYSLAPLKDGKGLNATEFEAFQGAECGYHAAGGVAADGRPRTSV
jgi:hypothetical protein